MTVFADRRYLLGKSLKRDVAQFSPDRKRFIVVVKRGNVANNTNEYSLLMFRTGGVFEAHPPDVIASFSSSSNRPGIQGPKWIGNHTIAFLGARAGEEQQLYTLDCDTKLVRKLTDHPTSLTAFAIGGEGGTIVFTAHKATKTLVDNKAIRQGIVVTNQVLSDLIALRSQSDSEFAVSLFVKRGDADEEHRIETHDVVVGGSSPLWLSPDGHYLIVRTYVLDDPPPSWKDYRDEVLQKYLQTKRAKGEPFSVSQFTLIDMGSGQNHPLVDAPETGSGDVMWSPDSKSVVVTGTYLSLDGVEAAERKARQNEKFIVEVRIPSREAIPITDNKLTLRHWDATTGKVFFNESSGSPQDSEGRFVAYQKREGGWSQVDVNRAEPSPSDQIEVTLEEGINTPPKIFVKDLKSERQSLLLDLNPQFRSLLFGRVDAITFQATDGRVVKAGLYLPTDYVPGRRYPLVIQTHGWNPQRFRIDGPYTTGFAAQPLAGKGFVVAQLDEDLSHFMTPSEVSEEAAAYEGVIDYLDRLKLIDRDRVGIIAFSRTGLGVEYALTHSQYTFAAASLDDISDSGYFRYLAMLNWAAGNAADNESLNGGLPFGGGLTEWLKNSPGFNLNRVQTPIFMQVNSPLALFFQWEWFVGLSRLGKPVDLILIPTGDHVLEKPSDRMISQQGNVDWFRFWLKHEEDPDPAKAEQYARWRELRGSQANSQAADTNTAQQRIN